MLTKKDRENILNFVLKKISDIANREYQERVWIRGEGPECDDFTETVCHFLDEGENVLDKYNEFDLTDSQYNTLKKFRDDFKVFSDKYNEAFEFIDTPEWAEIIEKAKIVLRAFNYIKKF